MYKSSSSVSLSFVFLLAGALALSGLFVTHAVAQDEQPIPEEATFESPVVANALAFVVEQGTTEEEKSPEVVVEVKNEVSVENTVSVETFSKPKEDDDNCPLPVKLVITKIKCANESDLPNWGLGGPDITANTASDFLSSHPSCTPVKHWGFEWGNQNVTNPGDDFLWEASPNNGWKKLGNTNFQGVLSVEVSAPKGTTEIRVREVLEPGYLPFSYGAEAGKNTNNVSAELYCADDVLNYDNFDFVRNPVAGKTYHCIAFNVKKSAVNQPPTITLIGANPTSTVQGTTFVDPGATATDPEDGPIGHTTSGSVNTAVLGTYTLTYTATDSGGLTASVTRTVNVVPKTPQCSDNIDNDNDGKKDHPADTGCGDPTDDDENNPPVIEILGANPFQLTAGNPYVDQGASSTDPEDGPLSPVVTSNTVNAGTVGTYAVAYKATDSKGLSAYATRTVNVVPPGTPPPQCSDNIDNDADGAIDFPMDAGCGGPTDNDENNAPILSIRGANPASVIIGNAYVDQGASSTDQEDGDLTSQIVSTSSVNTAALGSYFVAYRVSDSEGLSAHATRTVNVVPTVTDCSDGIDNDQDGTIDFPADLGCGGPTDDDENDAPILEVLGANPFPILVGTTYTDPGASSTDKEDGDITSRIVATGTVNTAVVGSYTIAYSVSDLDGLFAYATRTVNVFSTPTPPPPGGNPPPKCANGGDDDGDGKADYPADPGCTSSLDDDETDTPGGGGGGGTPGLQIFNERLTVLTPSSVKITWNTNLLADSRVVYGDLSKNPVGSAPMYGYPSTTATSTTATSSHEMTITGLPESAVAFFRPVSSNGGNTVVGVELVTPLVAGSCTYLEKYLRLGYANDPVEVTKLQRFLKEYEGFSSLQVTGTFDLATDKAVRSFQSKYGSEVLTPWGLPADTGYVYYTTKKKINEIYCQKAFPLDSAQLIEIAEYAKVSRDAVTRAAGLLTGVPASQPTVTVTEAPVVVDLSKIDLSGIDSKAPVVTLIPEKDEGELAGGVSTNDAYMDEEKSWLSKLLAALPLRSDRGGDDKGTTTASGTPVSLLASTAASVGVSTGTFLVWIILFAAIIILGYIMGRRNKTTV